MELMSIHERFYEPYVLEQPGLQMASHEADTFLGPHTVLTVPGVSMVNNVPVPLVVDMISMIKYVMASSLTITSR